MLKLHDAVHQLVQWFAQNCDQYSEANQYKTEGREGVDISMQTFLSAQSYLLTTVTFTTSWVAIAPAR